MKKYLLGALLIIGATSFGAVAVPVTAASESTGTGSAAADLPVKVVGKVLDSATKKVLVVTPMQNAGVSSGSLQFDFGNLIEGQDQQLDGTFKVEVMQSGAAVALTTDPTATLVGGITSGSDNKKATVKVNTGDITKADDVTLTYTLSNLAKQSDNSYLGTLTVGAKVETGANTGTFTDTSIGVKVKVENVAMS